ncbi:MAG: HD-GYP domain-containing protein, partial [Spirochaetes bacterium]|nr:HD-GYP domain-containing protein [Spirochaetota bacterium]
IFSILIGHLNKVPPKKIINLAVGSLLYDIGMAKIPQAIILKKEKLNIKELNFIKLHTIYGYKILVKDSNFPSEIASIALQHHEQFDGNGYPRKLRNEQIDLFSRIVAIADTFEAMTKKRTYRTEFLSYEAMKNLLGQSKNKFDPKLLRTFLANMSIYPIASLVKLNTNAIGLVIGAYEDKPLRPIIKIIIDEFNDKVPEEESRFVDLTKTPDLYITNAVDERQYQLNLFDYI